MTRILFDATSLDAEPSGSKTRLLRLAPELLARGHEVVFAVSERLDGARWPSVDARRRGPMGRWLHPGALSRHVEQSRADVLVFETWPAPKLDLPMIAVVHDLRHIHAGGLRRMLATAWLRDGARRVRRFHAVSQSTQAELEDALPEARGRIDVVPNAVAVLPDVPPAPLPPGLASPFVFAAGHSEGRKQWSFVGAVAADLARHGIKVVRAGRGSETHANVMDLGVIPDALRDALFRQSVAVLAPSRLEGFGLVPLEALACGAWVAASDIPAHREVLGDAADFFAVDDLVAAARRILAAAEAGESERSARASKARARASVYSPARSADAFDASLHGAGF